MFGDSNDQSGTLGFLIGIIVLIFAGIGFSLMADQRFKFSRTRISIEEALVAETFELEDARHRLEVAKEKWKKEARPRAGQDGELASAAERAGASGKLLKFLQERRETVEQERKFAEEAFVEYRNSYRKQVRSAAAGEKLAELTSRAGKTYTSVTIRRVTSVGIEIAHAQGISRLQPEDLNDSWHERFQWDLAEVEKVLSQEKTREAKHRASVERTAPAGRSEPVVAKPISKAKQAAQGEDKKLAALRREVVDALSRMREAESDAASAREEARMNRRRSAPGSLETWESKIRRLDGLTLIFREKYIAARGRLAPVSPTDSLLQDGKP